MNPNVSLTPDELQSELKTKREWLLVREADAASAEVRCGAARAKLNGYGALRMFLVQRGRDLTARRLALAADWAARINAGERDLAAGARELQELISETNFAGDVLMKTSAGLEPEGRIDLLVATVDWKTALADVAQLNADVHSLEVLTAGGAVAALEGSVEIKGARSQELARIAFQVLQDQQQAVQALETEQQVQAAQREKRTGPIQWHKPA